MTNDGDAGLDRRAFFSMCTLAGVGHPVFAEALWRRAHGVVTTQGPPQPPTITKEMVAGAAALIGLEFSEQEKDELVQTLGSTMALLATVR